MRFYKKLYIIKRIYDAIDNYIGSLYQPQNYYDTAVIEEEFTSTLKEIQESSEISNKTMKNYVSLAKMLWDEFNVL